MSNSNINTTNLILGGGLLFAAYLIIKKVGQGLTIFKSDAEIAAEKQQEKALQQTINSVLSKQKPTKTEGEWGLIVSQIFDDLKQAVGDNNKNAVINLARAKNEADVYTMIKLFGKRQEHWFGVPRGGVVNLQQFVRNNLNAKEIATVNNNYKNKGIKYRF